MPKKTTLKGQFLRTSLAMLVLSLLIGVAVMVAVMIFFTVRVPDGEKFLMESLSFLFGKQTIGPSRMVPVFVLAGVLLCLMVTGVCILLTSRLTGRITATLKTLRQAADNLRDGELDFQILSCDERELDELSHSLESVRQRLKATAVAEAAAQEERGLLMANLSHDLRTPITAIKGYVEGIQDGIANTPEKQRHYLEIVYNKSVILERLVRNMSDFSEYELGRMQYHFEYVEMGPFLRDLAEEYQVDVQQNGMTFTAQIPQGHYVVTADRSKLKRVLDNLVSNAIKYGRAGGAIALTAEEYERGLVIQVSDNGKGISAQALRHVFDSFFREDSARTSSVPGSGGHPGLPLSPAPERRGVAVMKILIIEDDQSVAELERDYLEINGGFQCDLYTDGTQGLQAALAGDYALVIVDVMLPGLSGFEICRRLREVKDTPVIIISALADDIDKVRGLGLGADDYMTKPFSPSELVARVKGHIQRYQRLVGSREKARPEMLKVRGLEIDRESRRVWVNGKETNMTSKEYDLLLFLAEHPDTVFSKDRLFDSVWGVDAYGDVSTVTVHIKHIRDKIELNPDRTQDIETVWGVGYRFRG